jgi:hypothetical protein
MPGTRNFESGQHVEHPWSQSNARRDVKFRSLAVAPVGRGCKSSEKKMDQAHLNVFGQVVAVRRAEAGGARKVSIREWYGVLFDIVATESPNRLAT